MKTTTWFALTSSNDILFPDDSDVVKDHNNKFVRRAKISSQTPYKLEEFSKGFLRLPSRAIAKIYGKKEDALNFLRFPLWDAFLGVMKDSPPNRVVVLTTDRENAFPDAANKGITSSYWEDTGETRELYKKYLENQLPKAKIEVETLKYKNLQQAILQIQSVLQLENSADLVYASAPTSPISSIFQLGILSRFGENASFLFGEPEEEWKMRSQGEYRVSLIEGKDFLALQKGLSS